MKIAILGAGPAGLLAAWAAYCAGQDPVIYSNKVPSKIGGAQYLHRSIPGLTSLQPDGFVRYKKEGDRDGYAKKVYGDPTAETSWENYDGIHPIWNMRKLYDAMWEIFESKIVDQQVGARDLDLLPEVYGKIFSAIPRPSLCNHTLHQFKSQDVWIQLEADYAKEGQIVYSGDPGVLWYRQSVIFGTGGTEYGLEVPGAVRVRKPLSTDCNCRPEIHKVGRYGLWSKPVLIHHAFEDTINILEGK